MSLLEEITDDVDVDDVELRMSQRRMALIQQINEALERKGWTQARLAGEMGKEDSQITRLLSPTSNPTLRTLVEIENALDCELFTVNRNVQYKLEEIPSLNRKEMFSQSQEKDGSSSGINYRKTPGNYQNQKGRGELGESDFDNRHTSGTAVKKP